MTHYSFLTKLVQKHPTPSKVLKTIRSLDSSRDHGWDRLSTCMIKICDAEIVIPLCLIYEKYLATGRVP